MGTNDVFMSGRVMMATNYIYIYIYISGRVAWVTPTRTATFE